MIQISNCPESGLVRKVTKQLHKIEAAGQVILECTVHYFNSEGQEINNLGIHQFTHKLVATNSIYVNPFSTGVNAGRKWTKEESEAYDAIVKSIADYQVKKALYDAAKAAFDEWVQNGSVGYAPVMVENPGDDAPAPPAIVPMGQFDFLMTLSKMPVNIDELEKKEVMDADAAGKFNI